MTINTQLSKSTSEIYFCITIIPNALHSGNSFSHPLVNHRGLEYDGSKSFLVQEFGYTSSVNLGRGFNEVFLSFKILKGEPMRRLAGAGF